MMIQDYLRGSAESCPDKIALECGGVQWTYDRLEAVSDRLASSLLDLGVAPGDRVIVFLDNSCEVVLSIFAILKIRAIFVVLNPLLPVRKLRYIVNDSGASLIVTDEDKLSKTRQALSNSPLVANILLCRSKNAATGDGHPEIPSPRVSLFEDACSAEPIDLFRSVSNGTSIDLASIIYTSGSTGVPKGVVATHLNVVSAVESINGYLGNTADDVILNVLPLSFDYGLYQIFLVFAAGGKIVIERRYGYPYALIEKLEEFNITGFPLVPTIASTLVRLDKSQRRPLPCLRYLTNTGDVLPATHIRHLQNLFPGAQIFSMYGLTECKRVSYLPPSEIDKRPNSVGIPMPNCEVSIVDENDRPVACEQVGELVVRGPHVMQGYWNAPEDTRRVFRKGACRMDARLYTGDLFRMDRDGYLYFVSRKDNLLKIHSERVSPKEIESALYEIEAVAEAAIVVEKDRYEQKFVTAMIVLAPDKSVSENDILEYCADRLEPHLVPKKIQFLKSLPKNENGKINRSKLCSLLTEKC